MPFIGNKPSAVPLTSADITDNIIVNADINTNAGITTEKLNLISTASVASVTAKGTPSVSDGYIQLNCEQNSHGIKIKSPPHSAGANYTLVMPSATGTANQSLRMNSGATALEFATVSGSGEGFSAFDMASNASGTLVLSSTLLNTNSNYSTINGRYTAPSTGTYYFFAHANPVSTSGDFCFTKNGSNLSMGTDYGYSANSSTVGNISIVISLTTSDYINFKTAQTVYTNYIAFGGFKLY